MAVAAFPRGRLASLAVLYAFVLGALWLLNALFIAMAVDRCLAVEGYVWDDTECRLSIKYPTIVAVISLIQMAVLLRREVKAEAEAQIGEAAGGSPGALPDHELQALALGPEHGRLRDSNETAMAIIVAIYLFCGLVVLLGKMIRWTGAELLMDHPGDRGAAVLVELGSAMNRVGILALSVEHCCLVIPYVMLRLRRFLTERVGGSVSA